MNKSNHFVYRLTLDENGMQHIEDYTLMQHGLKAFKIAKRRLSVFSADLRYLSMDGANRLIETFEREA